MRLIASAGKFSLDSEILGYVRHSAEVEKAKLRERELKRKDEYDSLLVQVQAIKDKNLPPEKWTSTQLHTMIQWYRHPEDAAIPSKKADKLTRYFEICGRGDPAEPSLVLAAEIDNSMAIRTCLCP